MVPAYWTNRPIVPARLPLFSPAMREAVYTVENRSSNGRKASERDFPERTSFSILRRISLRRMSVARAARVSMHLRMG